MSQRTPSVAREPGVDIEPDVSVTSRIVTTIAEREGVDPIALDSQLYEAVDPDALAALAASDPETQLTISFNYTGYRVTVIADEELVVDVTPLA